MSTAGILSDLGTILIAVSMLVMAVFALEGKLIALLGVYGGGILLLGRATSRPILLAMFIAGVSNCVLLASGHTAWNRLLALPKLSYRNGVKFLLWLIAVFIAYAAEELIGGWIPMPKTVLRAVLILFFCGLVYITTERDLLTAFIYLQCIFFAFEMLYLLLERSVLIFCFLTGIGQLISFVAAYMTLGPDTSADTVEEDIP